MSVKSINKFQSYSYAKFLSVMLAAILRLIFFIIFQNVFYTYSLNFNKIYL